MGSLRIVGVLIIVLAIIGAWLFSMVKRGERAQELENIVKEARKYSPFKIKGIYSSVGGRNDVDKLVKQAKESGFNVIIWFVNPRWGQARYNTSYFPCGAQCKADLLSYLVKRAHEEGLKVWAWFGFMGYRRLLEEHPSWAAVYSDSKSTLERPCRVGAGEEYYPMNPANPEVVEFWRKALLELVEKYEIDGVNFEDDYGYCYCGARYSYDEYNRRGFESFLRKRGVNVALKWPDDVVEGGSLYDLWVEYKCEVVENVTRILYNAIKEARPDVEVSLAASPSLDWSKRAYGVNWVRLGRLGLFDSLTFMVYTSDDARLESTVRYIFEMMRDSKAKPIIIIGWELRNSPPAAWIRQALIVRKLGGEDIIVFWDGGLDKAGAWDAFKELFEAMRGED